MRRRHHPNLKAEIRRSRGASRSAATSGCTRRGTSAAACHRAQSQAGGLTQMTELLQQGAALFGQTVLVVEAKAGAFRRLTEQWRGARRAGPPGRPTRAAGRRVQMAADAFGATRPKGPRRPGPGRVGRSWTKEEARRGTRRGERAKDDDGAARTACSARSGTARSPRPVCSRTSGRYASWTSTRSTRAIAWSLPGLMRPRCSTRSRPTCRRRSRRPGGWPARCARRSQPDGLNLLQANGAAAFQSVPHFHLHLIPRWNGDGKGFDWKPVPGDRARIQAAAEKIRAALP